MSAAEAVWQWIGPDAVTEPDASHMPVDADLFEQVGCGAALPTIRCYTWEAPAVTIGRLQNMDSARAQFGDELPLYRRRTGGRAVRHGDDLTITVAAMHSVLEPAIMNGNKGRGHGVLAEYRIVVAPVRAALATFGVSTVDGNYAVRHSAADLEQDCFAKAARCDVLDGKYGIKLLGSAMCRTADATLVQMSLRSTTTCEVTSRGFIDELREQYARYLNIGRWDVAQSGDGICAPDYGHAP